MQPWEARGHTWNHANCQPQLAEGATEEAKKDEETLEDLERWVDRKEVCIVGRCEGGRGGRAGGSTNANSMYGNALEIQACIAVEIQLFLLVLVVV